MTISGKYLSVLLVILRYSNGDMWFTPVIYSFIYFYRNYFSSLPELINNMIVSEYGSKAHAKKKGNVAFSHLQLTVCKT